MSISEIFYAQLFKNSNSTLFFTIELTIIEKYLIPVKRIVNLVFKFSTTFTACQQISNLLTL